MQTTYHAYNFNTENPDEAAAYKALCERMKAAGIKCFETWGGRSHYNPDLDGHVLTLETKHLFDNQWNTAPVEGISEKGLRVFDWAQDYPIDFRPCIKRGHYLDVTPEMSQARAKRHACGYCGHQTETPPADGFCDQCLDSQYLTEKDLPLLRMQPVCLKGERAPMTDAERDNILPRFKAAQLHGTTERGKARIAKQRADIQHKRDVAIDNANTEANGMLWLIDHGISVENVIYYKHTGRFCFGWRKPVEECVKSELLDVLTEFPFDYDIK